MIKKVDIDNCLATTHPNLVTQWHGKNKLTVYNVTAISNKRVWWICPYDADHEWITSIYHRTIDGTRCPFCSGNKVALSNCLATMHPDLSTQWHNKNILTAYDVTANSNKKVWWIGKCGHQWEATVANRTRVKSGCPYCTKFGRKKVNLENCLATTHPDLCKEWHPKNEFKSTDVVSGTKRKIWWKCPKGHDYESSIVKRSKDGRGCPYCANKKVNLENCLATTHPNLCKEWHPKNELKPTDVVSGSDKFIWWICKKNMNGKHG